MRLREKLKEREDSSIRNLLPKVFWLTYRQNWSKDRAVLHRGAVPLLVPELELALRDAPPGSPSHVQHVVRVEHAQLLLAIGQASDLLAQRVRRPDQVRFVVNGAGALEAEAPGR